MRLVAWNLGHKAKVGRIKPRFVEAVDRLKPDVLALNEYVHDMTSDSLRDALTHLGLLHIRLSERLKSNNQILIASRQPVLSGNIIGPPTEDSGGESNFLHVKIPDQNLEVVGVRAPAYKSGVVLQGYWKALSEIIRAARSRRIVFFGDLNADPDSTGRVGDRHLAALRNEGWSIPSPSGGCSYIAGSRIDHALLSPSVGAAKTEYIASVGDIILAARGDASCISDHAALLVTLGGTNAP